MNNNRGLTLIEVLATITVMAVVLGAATLLLSSVSKQWTGATTTNSDNANMKNAMDRLARELTDAQSIRLISTNEMRVKTNQPDAPYKSITFVPNADPGKPGTLSISKFSNDGNTTNDAADYTNTAISMSSTPSKYSSTYVLATNVKEFPTVGYLSYVSPSPGTSPSPSGSPTPQPTYPAVATGGYLHGQEALQLTVTFLFTLPNKSYTPKTMTTAIKLLQDF